MCVLLHLIILRLPEPIHVGIIWTSLHSNSLCALSVEPSRSAHCSDRRHHRRKNTESRKQNKNYSNFSVANTSFNFFIRRQSVETLPLRHRGAIPFARNSSIAIKTCSGRRGVGLQCLANAKCFILHPQSLNAPNAKEQEELLRAEFLTFKEAFAKVVKFKPERSRHTRKPEPSIDDPFIDSIFQRDDFTLFRLFTFSKEVFVVSRRRNIHFAPNCAKTSPLSVFIR